MRALEPVTNGGAETIEGSAPYIAHIRIEGSTPFLFHRWVVEAVAEKAKAAKGSKAKKSDDLESYVYRVDNGNLGIPGEYLRQAVIHAAKFQQDPRSPRKSAMDLFKAGVVALTEVADTGKAAWDYVDQRRVTIQRNGITRSRPALNKGWVVEFEIMVNLPEYIPKELLRSTIEQAGRLIGIGDFRPTYGRFGLTEFKVEQAT
jgi:hypothetical protein